MTKEWTTKTPGIKKYELKTKNKSNGKYFWFKVEFRYKDTMGNSKKIKKGGFERYEDAKKYMEKVKNEMSKTSDVEFSYVYQEFLEKIYNDCTGTFQEIKASTGELKVCVLENHIKDYFKNMKLSDINKAVIEDWKDNLKNKKYSLKNRGKTSSIDNEPADSTNEAILRSYSMDYLNRCFNYLSQLFEFAISQAYIEESPMKNIPQFKNANKKEIRRIDTSKYWTLEEYKSFINYTKKYKRHYYYLFETVFWSGARIGEVLALKKKDIDFDKKVIYINENTSGKEAYKDENGNIKFKKSITSPKNGKSRVVSMSDSFFKEIAEYMNTLYGLEDDERIFKITKKTAQNFFKRVQENMLFDGIKIKRMSIHGLRHAYIIHLLSSDENISLSVIANKVGHSRVEITEMYADLIEDRNRRIANYDEMARKELGY